MYMNITVKDLNNVKSQNINYNEVLISRNDIINMPMLMQFLSDNNIFVEVSLELNTLTTYLQNQIGLIFLDFYGYLIHKDGESYFNESKLKLLIGSSEKVISYLKRSAAQSPTLIENALNYHVLTSTQLNSILMYWFSAINRNFRNVDKFVDRTVTLYDIDLNQGYFNKLTGASLFLSTMFSRFVRTQKGSIPFSNDFGSSIKQTLHRKADFFTRKIIIDELTQFVNDLTSIYEDEFTLVNIIYNEETVISTSLTVYIILRANQEEEINFKLIG